MALLTPKWLFFHLAGDHDDDVDGVDVEGVDEHDGDDGGVDEHEVPDDDQGVQHTNIG